MIDIEESRFVIQQHYVICIYVTKTQLSYLCCSVLSLLELTFSGRPFIITTWMSPLKYYVVHIVVIKARKEVSPGMSPPVRRKVHLELHLPLQSSVTCPHLNQC